MTILNVIELGLKLSPLGKAVVYLDPGSGSFILQLLIASAVGLAFAFRSSLAKIKNIFKKGASEENDEDDDLDELE